MRGYTNWELSADRANASRRELVNGGLPESKIAKVVGLSSTVLFDAKSPQSPINRRISLIVMNKQAEDKIISEAGALAGLANKANTPKSFGRPSKPITMLPSKGKPLLIPGKPTIQQIGAPLQLGKPKTKPNPSNKNNEKTIKLQTF
jgi:chemotaxis protein MotB